MKKYLIAAFILGFSTGVFAQNKNSRTDTFKVLGACEMCKSRIEKTVSNLGAYSGTWDMQTHLLTVSFDSLKLSKEKIQKRLAAVGHDSEGFRAKDGIYTSLPACCHYDRSESFNSSQSQLDTLVSNIIHHDAATIVNNPTIEGLSNITGVVLEETKKGKLLPLQRATVGSLDGKNYVNTDSLGVFHLSASVPSHIVVSYVGYKPDTLFITNAKDIKVILKNSSTVNLREVVVNSRTPSTYVSTISVSNTLNMGIKELTKAACCNLSESFETSPSVDVSYSDAVIGMKQIQLLGLSGIYTQLLTENIPEIRGLAGSYGLTFVPGPWLESIQVTKGAGSVVNGYESIAGQINIEEKKPDRAEKLFINGYANNLSRLETSVNYAKTFGSKWSTALLAHANGVTRKIDDNKDGFMDIPTGRQFNFINRWRYADTDGRILQFGIKVLDDRRQAGQMNFNPQKDKLTTNSYGVGIGVQQYQGFAKFGYVFPQQKYKSIGIIVNAGKYMNDSYFGISKYDGEQNNVYANLIYQSIIGNTMHKFRTGLSLMNEQYKETFRRNQYARTETVPGAYFEYTYSPGDNFSAIAGIRGDLHNNYGFIITPRLHLKYDFSPKTNLRLSGGSGFRTANIFAENTAVFISSRKYYLLRANSGFGYGLQPEKAWNYGINFIHNFEWMGRNGSISFDGYRTEFANQVIADADTDAQSIIFYNLNGKSYSNSLQAELNYELIPRLDLRLAYRWLDVKTQYISGFLQKPLVAKHRAFINLAYETTSNWKFDLTTQWLGKKRLPNTAYNPMGKQMEEYAPSYLQMSAQVLKKLGNKWEAYIGGENLTGYTQEQLFIDGNNPFSNYFDGSITWGPVNGRVVYAGFRYRLK